MGSVFHVVHRVPDNDILFCVELTAGSQVNKRISGYELGSVGVLGSADDAGVLGSDLGNVGHNEETLR